MDVERLEDLLKKWSARSGIEIKALEDKIKDEHTFSPIEKIIYVTDSERSGVSEFKLPVKMCTECISHDLETLGVAYAHRAHNFPGVDACHIHGIPISKHCDGCGSAHAKHKVSDYLICRSLVNSPLGRYDEDNTNFRYAVFIHEILSSNLEPLPPAEIKLVVSRQIHNLRLGLTLQIEGWNTKTFKYARSYFREHAGAMRKSFHGKSILIEQASKLTFALFKSFESYAKRLDLRRKKDFAAEISLLYEYNEEAEIEAQNRLIALLESSRDLSRQDFIERHYVSYTEVSRSDSNWLNRTMRNYGKPAKVKRIEPDLPKL